MHMRSTHPAPTDVSFTFIPPIQQLITKGAALGSLVDWWRDDRSAIGCLSARAYAGMPRSSGVAALRNLLALLSNHSAFLFG